MSTPAVYETHMHTPLCGHAVGNPGEYAAVAEERGLAGIVVTCHNPMPDLGFGGPTIRMAETQLPRYLQLIEEAAEQWSGRVDVRAGLECDYLPGFESYLAGQLEELSLHHVLGSVHPQLKIWRDRYGDGDPVDKQKLYFDHLAMAAESRLFDTLSHPDMIKNVTVADWDIDRVLDHIRLALDRVARTGVAMELNTSGVLKPISEMNPAPSILVEMFKRDIPVTVGADAHDPSRVADRYDLAYDLLESIGYTEVSIFLDRKRRQIPIPAARASLNWPSDVIDA